MKKLFALLALTLASLSFAQADEVTEIATDDGISKKWEFKFDGTASFGLKDENPGMDGVTHREDALLFNVGVGYNFNSNIYAGIASGYFPKYGAIGGVPANDLIPLLGDFVYRWNLSNPKWSIFAEGRAGYLFSIHDDVDKGKTGIYEYSDMGYFELQPGVYYRLRPNIDIRFSIGYAYSLTRDEANNFDLAHNENCLNVKLGMNFRSAPKMEVRTTPIEEPVSEPQKPETPEPETITPEPVKIVETTTEEQKKLGEREVVIFYIIRKHNILPEKDALLEEMAEFTKTHKTSKIIVKSYADKGTGNYKLNQMYSRNRMNEVVKHLVEQYGISRDQIEASYYGDTVQPYEENDLNRCSIIVVKEVE